MSRRASRISVVIISVLLVRTSLPAEEERAEKPAAQAPAVPEADEKPAADTPAKPADPPKKAEPNAAPNPVADFFRNLFGGAKAKPRVPGLVPRPQQIPEEPAAAEGEDEARLQPVNGDRTARDFIDARAPYFPDQAALLRKAAGQIDAGHFKEAIEMLQRLFEWPEDSLIRDPNGSWVSVRVEANRLLGRLPQDVLDRSYRVKYGPTAEQYLRKAYSSGDPGQLADVATRYFHTEAGYQAANALGTLHFDRGEFGLAAHWFKTLLEAHAPITRESKWQLKAALAFHRAGDSVAREQLIGEITAGPNGDSNPRYDTSRWLKQTGPTTASADLALEDWRMLYGTPSRTGTAVGGEPLLLPRWSQATTASQPVRDSVAELVQDLTDQGLVPIPASFPLTVGGKVIFRTLRGVQVVDAESGKALWETREGISAERLLSGNVAQVFQGEMAWRFGANRMGITRYSSGGGEQHPLANLLFRNGTYGIISSDGTRLYVLEDHAILSNQQQSYRWGGIDPDRSDPYRRHWSSNKIVAYDLNTGRPEWEIGGAAMDEAFDLPLAGFYFFGVPVPDGNELFVVGERNNEIRLLALDARSGLPKWSQLIAFSDVKIDRDFGRRWWTAQVSVANGVLICPTTVGWLVAVDRLNHSVLWAHRYTPPTGQKQRGFRENQGIVQNAPLNARWSPAAPIIADNRVVYPPSEDASVVCLNLFDGKQLWKRSKDQFLYLAGVFENRVLLVGADRVAAVSLKDGADLWTLPIPATEGKPSGHGVAVGDQYHLPLSSGQLWSIDLAEGKVLAKSYLPGHAEPLGNLAMYRGMLLSLNSLAMTSFEQRDSVEEQIRRRIEHNAHDSWARIREADIHLLNRDYNAALASLRLVRPEEVSDELRPRYRQGMVQSLATLIRSDFQAHDREIEELADVVTTEDERLLYRRLSAERLAVRGDHRAAFDLYWELAAAMKVAGTLRVPSGPRMVDGDNPQITVRMDLWLAGKLADLWQAMPEEMRASLEERISPAAEEALNGDVQAQEWFVTIFGFHPSALPVQQNLVESYAKAGNFAAAEIQLLRLIRIADSSPAQTEIRNPKSEIVAATERLARLRQEHKLGPRSDDPGARLSWGNVDVKVVRSGSYYMTAAMQDLDSRPFRLPFFQNYRFQVDQQHQRLSMVDAADESVYWLLPLRGDARSQQGQAAARSAGHLLMVLHRDVLHCLSPAERKVLWTRPLDSPGRASGYYRMPNTLQTTPMQQANQGWVSNILAQHAGGTGMLAAANDEYVCVYGRRSFSLLDSLTGEVRWTRDDLPPHAVVYGNETTLYIVPQHEPDAGQPDAGPTALRALDGKQLDVPNIAELLHKAIYLTADGLVLVEPPDGSRLPAARTARTFPRYIQPMAEADQQPVQPGSTVVRLFDPTTDKEHWKFVYPGGAYFSVPEEGLLAALTPQGAFEVIDLNAGRADKLEQIAESELRSKSELYALTDRDNVYLIVNQHRGSSHYSDGLASLRANGLVAAFDRATGKQRWKQTILGKSLVMQRLDHSPLLLFTSRNTVRKGNLNYGTVSLLAVDKYTGRKLADSTSPSYAGFQSLEVNMAERYLELRSYNERIRLTAVNKETAAASPPATP